VHQVLWCLWFFRLSQSVDALPPGIAVFGPINAVAIMVSAACSAPRSTWREALRQP
jgi:hypothetical protein